MEEQVIFGCGSYVNSSREVKLEEDEEDFRSCCEDEDELKEREETAKEGSKNNLDDVSVNMFFKGVSIAEAGDCGAGVSGIGVVIERSANFPSIQVQKKLDFFVDESVADYLALMDGLLEAAQNKIMRVFAFTDSEILYDQSLSGKGLCRVSTNTPSYLHRLLRRSSDDHPPLSYRSSTITIVVEVSYLPAYITRNTMQDFIGSVCRSLVFKPSDAGGVFGGFVEKIGSIIRKPGIGLFSKPPVPALPPIAKSDAINVKKDDAFGRVYMGLKEKRHFKEKMQQQSKKDETKWKPLVRNRALKPSSLQLCMQMNEPDSNFGSKIWDPVGSDNTGSVNIWDYSDSEAAPASSWSTLPNRSLLCRPLPVDIGRCTCVIVKEALPEGLDGGNLYSLYTNTNKIRVELEEKQKQHARLLVLVLVLAIGVGVMKKMKEKDEQIQRMGKLNWVLQERVKSLYVENQLWRDLAQTNEAAANSLRSHLEQVLAHVSDDRPSIVGCGGGAAAEEEEDAESCCGSNDYGRNGEEVEVVGRRMLAVEGGDKVAVGGSSAGGGGEKRLCKKCGERESCVLVLPCRHLCLCIPCGSKYHHTCPVCNSYMNASVNVNLS